MFFSAAALGLSALVSSAAAKTIEVQVGSYTGEDDIIRVEDIYGR